MNLTEEHYKEIENMAGLFFSVEDICVNLELDEETTEQIRANVEINKDCNFNRAYKNRRLKGRCTLS